MPGSGGGAGLMPETDNIAIEILLWVLGTAVTAGGTALKIVWNSREKLIDENKQLWKDTAVREVKLQAHMEQQFAISKAQLKAQKVTHEKLDTLIEASQ